MDDLRSRIAGVAGPLTDDIIEILDEEAGRRCRDTDCLRWWPHSRLARHRWRHVAGAPLSRGLFGMRCFNCGRRANSRIHKKSASK